MLARDERYGTTEELKERLLFKRITSWNRVTN